MSPPDGADPTLTLVGAQPIPTDGYTATYAELTYTQNGKSFSLTTQIQMLAPQK
jgi:hypothetical protein